MTILGIDRETPRNGKVHRCVHFPFHNGTGTTETVKGNQWGKDNENEDAGDEGERRRGKQNKKGPGDISWATGKFFFLSFYFIF